MDRAYCVARTVLRASHSSPSPQLLAALFHNTKGYTLVLPKKVCHVVIGWVSKAKCHFWHELSCQILTSLNHTMTKWFIGFQWPLIKSNNHERLTSLQEAILHHPRSPEILVQIHMPWQMLLLLCLHVQFMHAYHTHDRRRKQTKALGAGAGNAS